MEQWIVCSSSRRSSGASETLSALSLRYVVAFFHRLATIFSLRSGLNRGARVPASHLSFKAGSTCKNKGSLSFASKIV